MMVWKMLIQVFTKWRKNIKYIRGLQSISFFSVLICCHWLGRKVWDRLFQLDGILPFLCLRVLFIIVLPFIIFLWVIIITTIVHYQMSKIELRNKQILGCFFFYMILCAYFLVVSIKLTTFISVQFLLYTLLWNNIWME